MRLSLFFAIFVLTISGCKKLVEVNPPDTLLSGSLVFSSDATATSALTGIYNRMTKDEGIASGYLGSISFLSGLSADELTSYNPQYAEPFYLNNIDPLNDVLKSKLWNLAYQYIYSANAVMEGVEKSLQVNESIKQQLTGETKFIRAFFHFYLVNLWGNVPLITTTNYIENNRKSRTRINEVYKEIINDLLDADNLIDERYISFSNELTIDRTRPNKFAIKLLLARAYLFIGEYQKAIDVSNEIIGSSSLYSVVRDLDKVFLKNSTEVIWQLPTEHTDVNTMEAKLYVISDGQTPSSATISGSLMNSFESNDQRKVKWIGKSTNNGNVYYFPYKYKIKPSSEITEYSVLLRFSEAFLIRAESLARLGLTSAAISDINIIRQRAGLNLIDQAISQNKLVDTILHERRIEFFSEWGHRWLDLKRTKKVDEVLKSLKPFTWTATDSLYPIPQSEILINPNLMQNPGY